MKKSRTESPEKNRKDSKNSQAFISENILPLCLFVVAIPISMVMWIGNLALSFVRESTHLDDMAVVPPTRWLSCTLIPLAIGLHGKRKQHVNASGALLGMIMGFFLTLSSYHFLICLTAFFLSSSKATKFRQERKKKIDEHFKEGGQRNWIQVLCNGGMATQLALLYILDLGCGERPIDFYKDYRGSWLSLGILGAFATCNGDTWASELGTVFGSSDPVLITSFKRVPKGTNGGVSIGGLIFSALGGAFIGLSYYLSVLYFVDSEQLALAPPQWPLILAGTLAGFFGSLFDSILGATLQFSGLDGRTGVVVEKDGKGIHHISGLKILDNHSVNLISSIVLGLLTPHISNTLWPYGK